MADPRTFVLIGEFQDGITPELQKINNQLAALKRNFSNLGGKGARNASRDMGRFAVASKELVNALKEQNQALRSVVEPMRQYRTEVGKTIAAMRKLQTVKGGARGIEETNRALQEQIRLLQRLRAEDNRRTGFMGGGRRPPMPPGGGGGYGGGQTPTGRPAPRGGGRGVGGGDYNMATFAFAFTLGQGLSQPITNAIVAGFQIGVGLMTKPFQYFAGAFGERVQDELSDLKAAGGLFSISKRSQNPFLKDIDEAIQYQQDTNKTFAKMAAALPGVTNDYVQVGKRLSDTAARIVSKDFSGALAEANKVRATPEGAKFYGQQITGTGPEAQREVITTLLGELTKKTTIAGLGGRTGAGGIAGAYGLPGITERLLSEDTVSVGKFQRYASVFSDPTVADALQRNVDKINATAMNSVERYKVIQNVLDEIVTPELIEKLRTSVDGIYQGLKSMILDPDTGLFGLGRNFEKFGKRLNQYGQYVDEAGNVVANIADAAAEDLSLFEIVRDIFSNLGQSLMPIVEVLPQIFDPLKNVAKVLMDVRHYAAEFNKTFNEYREGFKELAKIPGNEFLKESLDIRASLAAINNLFAEFGIITENEFLQTANQLKSKDLNIGATLSKMIDQFFDSDLAEKVGEIVGRVIGTVLSEVAKVTGFLADKVGGNKLASGFTKGFEAAGGPAAFTAIFEDVFKLMFEGLKFVMKALPWQAYALMAAAIVLPAAISGLGMLIAQGIAGALSKALAGKTIEGLLGKSIVSIKASIANFFATLRNAFSRSLNVVPVTVRDVTNEPRALPPAKTPAALPTAAIVPKVAKGMNAFTAFFGKIGSFLKGVGPRFLSFFKGFGGILTVVGGALTTLIALFKGENLAQALAKGAGPVLGAALGAALLPFFGPIGPMIGAAIGGWIGSLEAVTRPLAEAFQAIGDTLGPTLQSLSDALGSLFKTLGSAIMGLIGAFVPLDGAIDETTATIIGIKIALTPVVAAFQLIEQVANLLAAGFKGLQLAVLYARRGLSALNPFADPEKQLALDKEIAFVEQELHEINGRFGKALDRHMKWYETKPIAQKPGAYTPIPANLPKVSGLKPTAGEMEWYKQQMNIATAPPPTKIPSNLPKVSGLTPTAGEMDWYRKQMGGVTAPAKPPAAIQQTATNTSQLNQKAAQQVTATAATSRAAEATRKATQETKTAVVAQKGSLTSIQTTLSAMYGLLASGMLRVQTQYGMMGPNGMPLVFPGFTPAGALPGRPPAPRGPQVSPVFSTGLTLPRWKGNLGDAISEEVKHKPPGSSLVIANSSETIIPADGLKVRSAWGGMNTAPMTVNTTVTINQQPGQNSDELAAIVAMKIGEAVAQARSASVFV